jgi:hypothetical protein
MRETGTGQQVAQLQDRYTMMMMMMMMMMMSLNSSKRHAKPVHDNSMLHRRRF